MSSPPEVIVAKRLEEWRRRLIDLSYRNRNRLIKYREAALERFSQIAGSLAPKENA